MSLPYDRKSFRRVMQALGLSLGLVAGMSQAVEETVGERLVTGYIQPATTAFARAGEQMTKSLSRQCANVSAANGADVAADFRQLVLAWSGIEFLRFGPLVADNRYERVFFWPDPRGVTLRQTQAIIARENPALLAPGALRAGSVAVQGLASLEYALYGGNQVLIKGSGEADYRCRYALAVAVNLAGLGHEIQQAWSDQGGAARQFIAPGVDNPVYRSEREVVSEAIKALATGVQYQRDAKLVPALGASAGSAHVTRMPWSRSGLALTAMAVSLDGMAKFAQAGEFVRLLPDDEAWLAAVVPNSAADIARQLAAIDLPAQAALTETASRSELAQMALRMHDLKELINGQIAQGLGVSVGFNALDGD